MRVTATTRIACPPESVFELQSAEPIGLGSRFAVVNGGSAYDVTITTYDRPSRLVFEASGKA